LIVILKISQINCPISCITFRNATLAAATSEGFLQSAHLLEGLKYNVTNSGLATLERLQEEA
jgi:hypothetical protein